MKAKTIDELDEKLCEYCPLEEYQKRGYSSSNGYIFCEGSRCNEAYDNYLESFEELNKKKEKECQCNCINEFEDYTKKCLITWDGPDKMIRSVLGIVGESGEVAEKMKKYLRGDYNNKENNFIEELKKELGDVLFYLAITCVEYGFTLKEVAEKNIEKLADRKKRKRINGSGDNR